jgi:hypothetical protein
MPAVVRFPPLIRVRLLLIGGLLAGSDPSSLPAQAQPPRWFLDEVTGATAGTGRWIADNRVYTGPDEPADEYGLEWRQGPGGVSMMGRLFGLRDGREIATYWQFLFYWHPARQVAVILQVSASGVVGEGTIREREGGTVAEQVFHSMDGGSRRIRHESEVGPTERRDRSSDWVEGSWRPGRSYTWRLR